MRIALITSIVVAALATVFALSNTASVSVKFLNWSFSAPLALLIISTLVTGILAGYLSGLPARFKTRAEAKSLRKELDEANTNIQEEVAQVDEAVKVENESNEDPAAEA